MRRLKNWVDPNDTAAVSMRLVKTDGVDFGRSAGEAGFGLVSPTVSRKENETAKLSRAGFMLA